jgi:hypothetical protein
LNPLNAMVFLHLLQVQQHVWRFRTHVLILVGALLAVHTGLFILMYTLLQSQSALVDNLGLIGG